MNRKRKPKWLVEAMIPKTVALVTFDNATLVEVARRRSAFDQTKVEAARFCARVAELIKEADRAEGAEGAGGACHAKS